MVNQPSSERLQPRQSAEVSALVVRATQHDGVRPLSEQTVLDVRRLPDEPTPPDATPGVHLVVEDHPGEIDARVLGYAHVERSDPPSAEIVVDPEHRRGGVGGALLQQVLEEYPGVRVWAHGDLVPARKMADAFGLRPVRDLWQMARPLSGEWSELPEVDLPEGFAVRPFQVGQDEQAWLAVNARSFAAHAEQGRMTLTDLTDRINEPWFDPHGFLLVEDHNGDGPPRLAGFHWTKVESSGQGPTSGEVYVVGVDPDYQGRGLGKAVTVLGLRHLRACGLDTATLYVDGDNEPALATYHRLGFERSMVDVMYAVDGA
ncbi:mycothiol synthase [Ornithinicoccus hortensis]|uniref:Mycothiol acetyltransferase n=1 Tax=Ornithinicoccus hortensis TaxID=82346 RepID=A0A542YP45_9MICO|nr:mycothiol synthase [Ornithinicoccus hortensis]TQL49819.1 mycothiol synthase [Ornithinicoccus hortensis]